MEMIPYSFNGARLPLPAAPIVPTSPGVFMGVLITLPLAMLENMLSSIESWFEDRDEVILVDHGISVKQSAGYIILEWEECHPDVLFLSILDHEDVVLDYVCYTRESEVQ